MNVILLYFDGCPNWTRARDRVHEAMRRAGLDERSLTYEEVATAGEAEAVGFPGSPTILINGRDPFSGSKPAGFSCRLYQTPEGPDGAPSTEQLLAAMVP